MDEKNRTPRSEQKPVSNKRAGSSRYAKKEPTVIKLFKNNRIRALLSGFIALLILVFVVLGAVGAFDSEAQRAEKAARKEAKIQEQLEKEAATATTEEETEETETTTEAETVDPNARTVYLTFEGCADEVTDDILAALADNNVKATFFVSGNANGDTLQKIVDGGHSIGVYSVSGTTEGVYTDLDSFKEDVQSCRQYIFQKTGVLTDLYRFPGGSLYANEQIGLEDCKAFLEEEGMVYYDWNIESGDDMDVTVDAETIASTIIGQIGENEYKTNVVHLIDTADKTTTAEALESVIVDLKSSDFAFAGLSKTTPEMTFDVY